MSDHDEVNEGAGGADDLTAAPQELAAEGSEAAEPAFEGAPADAVLATTPEAASASGAEQPEVVADVVAAAAGASSAAGLASDDDDERAAVAYGWTYLAVLATIFGVVALLAFSCDSDTPESTTPVATTAPADDTATVAEAATPVALSFVVADGVVTLTGAVPDEGARQQLVDAAAARYGEGNVVDQLTIDEGTTLTGGSITTTGSAVDGDPNPAGLQADLVASLGLTDGGVDVTYEVAPLTPVDAEAALSAGTVVLTGELPDQASIDAVIAAAEGVWGAENVDGSGLVIGDVTWAQGQIRVTGSVDAGDTRGDEFAAALAAASSGATIDTSGLTVDTGAEALARSEEQLRAALEANPILFETGSAEIDPASDEIITQAAAAINAAGGINVEVVGHTDDQGGEAANEQLSAARADAVVARLIELGVDEARLTSRGAGESEPIVENDSDENRARNRRIEFSFEGAA